MIKLIEDIDYKELYGYTDEEDNEPMERPQVVPNDIDKDGYIVEIVYDYAKKKYRARTNDGINGEAWCQFPNHLRIPDAIYKVSNLSYSGKFYRCSGAISRIA